MSAEEKKEILDQEKALDEDKVKTVAGGGVIESARSAEAEQITAKEMSDEEKKEVLDKADTLDENEAEAVAGGQWCWCVGGGGGESDEWSKTCACIAGGGGEWSDKAMRWLDKKKRCRCWCAIWGEGDEEA